MAEKPIIFISCGQVTDEEKKLGAVVCQLVKEQTSYEPYYAENQTSLEELTKNILGNLNRCVGLIVIMHPRGMVTFPNGQQRIRASIWIEQEIAIAAFLTQIFSRNLRVAAYIHRDIKREGMRDKLQLNPTPFSTENEIIEHLRNILPMWETFETVDDKTLESHRQMVYSLAIEILSKLQGKFFKNNGLPGYLWSQREPGWWSIYEILMERFSDPVRNKIDPETGNFKSFTIQGVADILTVQNLETI